MNSGKLTLDDKLLNYQLLMCLVEDPVQLDNLKELLEKVNSH